MARKILFKHHRAPGDILMLTCGIRDFHFLFPDIKINAQAKSDTQCLFDNNPYIDPSIKDGDPGVETISVGYPHIQGSNEGYIHFTQSFLSDMIVKASINEPLPMSLSEFLVAFYNGGSSDDREGGKDAREPFIGWGKKFQDITKKAFKQRPDIHLTDKEMKFNPIKDTYGADHYWVIAPGGKRDCTCKMWDWRRFQKVIDHFEGQIKFVTIGRSDHLLEKLDNVIDWTDKTKSIRDLIPLVTHAHGCVSGISFLHHLSAACPHPYGSEKSRKPCVTIYGGREPSSFTWFPHHQSLHTHSAIWCCDNGGCWQSRITPEIKDPENNSRMCHNTVVDDGKTIQKCMDMIPAEDVIRAISKYYEGDMYTLPKPIKRAEKPASVASQVKVKDSRKQINILASLQSRGGGEQSALKIQKVLENAGWDATLYPWDKVHERWRTVRNSFKSGKMLEHMKPDIPLLFYANDQIKDFCKRDVCGEIVNKSSAVIIGINFMNGDLPSRAGWLEKTGKVRGVVFQNREKMAEFKKAAIGFEYTKLISLFGAIELDEFYQLPQSPRIGDNEMIILKHCTPDWRKYVTTKSKGDGDKPHVWQREHFQDKDTEFYAKLLKECKFPMRFEFMEAHKELAEHFAGDPRFIFHKFDSMPVTEFLKRGHVYLYRTSYLWRDQYPRGMAEAMAAGLPVLGEPRDGPLDRIQYGDTGYFCDDFDQYKNALKKLHRKEGLRVKMGMRAKQYARDELDPRRWVDTIEEVLS